MDNKLKITKRYMYTLRICILDFFIMKIFIANGLVKFQFKKQLGFEK